MERTGEQIFRTEVFDKIDLSLKVTNVIEAGDTNVRFELCDKKWLRKGIEFTDDLGNIWTLGEVDPVTGYLNATPPAEGATLVKNQKLEIQRPSLLVGTPLSVNAEEAKRIEALGRTRRPIVWLRETIPGKWLPRNSGKYREFEFLYYALDDTDSPDWTHEDRHLNVVSPMTQLSAAIKNAVNKRGEVELVGEVNFKEFNKFGTETKMGIVREIITAHLGGLENRMKVQASKGKCC